MVSKRLQNIIFNKYVDSHRCILEQIRSQKFWNTCNTDEMGEILFFTPYVSWSSKKEGETAK